MSTIVKVIKFIWNGFLSLVTWFVGLPALIAASVVGIYSSIRSLLSSFSQGSDLSSAWFGVVDAASDGMIQGVSAAPDIVKLAMYALSLDTLFTYLTSVFALFIVLTVALLTFFCVSIPVFLIEMYAVKLSAWFICALFPKGASITAVSALASMDLSRPIRQALKDGKYNPFLGG